MDFMTFRNGEYDFDAADGTIVSEFQYMELLQKRTSSNNHNAYTCSVASTPNLQCLDIAAVSTLSNYINTSLYNAIVPIDVSNNTNYFGGSRDCVVDNGVKISVGDGIINVYDISVLIWWHFRIAPYHNLDSNPSKVETVFPRAKTADRCNDSISTNNWSAIVAKDYCYSIDNSNDSNEESRRMLMQEPNYGTPEMDSMVEIIEWARVANKGSWHRIRIASIQLALELFFDSLYTENAIELSNDAYPPRKCQDCEPQSQDSNGPVVRFARRYEYEPYGLRKAVSCALIHSSFVGLHVMKHNVLSIRQQPIENACEFDIFAWQPLGASSVYADCNSTLGVMSGSSAMDGVYGLVQQNVKCSRALEMQGQAPPPPVHPVPSPHSPPSPPANSSNVVIIIAGSAALTLSMLAIMSVFCMCRDAAFYAVPDDVEKEIGDKAASTVLLSWGKMDVSSLCVKGAAPEEPVLALLRGDDYSSL